MSPLRIHGCLGGWLLLTLLGAGGGLGQEVEVKHALLFGISKYQATISGVPDLAWARNDADKLREALGSQWETRAFFDVDVNRRTIIAELTRLARVAKQQDTVLVYFAGHGVRDRVGQRSHTYWLTYPATLADLAVEGIRLSHLLDYIEDIRADRKIVLLDHCNSGDVQRPGVAAGGSRDTVGGASLAAVSRDLFPKDEVDLASPPADRSGAGIVILGAARDAAYELRELEHGLFTHGLLAALSAPDADTDDSKRLSLAEVWTRAQREMERAVAELTDGESLLQEPIEIINGSGLLRWELFDAAVSPQTGVEDLREILTELDGNTDFGDVEGGLALALTLQELRSWERSKEQGLEPSATSSAVVGKLRQIRGLTAVGWEAKMELLLLELRQQGLIS